MNRGRATIIKDTNKLISAGFENWKNVRPGSFFKFVSDSNHYIISRIDPLFYLVEFEKIDSKKIKVNGDTGININVFDTVTISYKEWEVQTIDSIISPGQGYKIGNILTVDGGKPSFDIQSNLRYSAKIEVANINEFGAITRINLAERGKYYTPPEPQAKIIGGNGNGALFEIKYKTSDNRTVIEKDVEDISFDGKETIITINYELPEDVKFGKIGADKWEVYLSSLYLEGTKINEVYEITRDFTPNIQLPLLAKNSLNISNVFNTSQVLIDRKIKEFEDRIKKLES